MALGDYAGQIAKKRTSPDNAFSLANAIALDTDIGRITEMSKILNKNVLMGNIKDDKYIRIYQVQYRCLIELFDMAGREAELAPLFMDLYHMFLGELNITRIKGGLERKILASTSSMQMRSDADYDGFGQEVMEQYGQEDKRENPVSGFLKKFRRPQRGQG